MREHPSGGRPRSSRAPAHLLLLLALAIPASARAQDEEPEASALEAPPETPRPFFVSAGVGVALRLDGFVPTAFRIAQEIGVHESGVPNGAFLAIMLAEDIASHYSMQLGVRVGWDLEILRRDFSVVISPSLGIAFAFDVMTGGRGDWGYFLAQPTLGIALLVADRMVAIWARPLTFDIYIGEQQHGGYAATLGASISF